MEYLILSLSLFLLFLIYERISLDRWRDSIPLRIAVTGTRGKSSVVRMLASVLREDGRKVLAKSTGSRPMLQMPDGSELDIRRRGTASIIEQKKLIRRAKEIGADCVIAEIMSIHPENHCIESQEILKPHMVVITNVRRDHLDAMGDTEDEIASVLSLTIPANSRVFIPSSEERTVFHTTADTLGAELISVEDGISIPFMEYTPAMKWREFTENLDLVLAVAKDLGIADGTVANGILKSIPDPGAMKVWKYRCPGDSRECFLVNGFAANDPDSTMRVVSKIREVLPSAGEELIGLLCLREDRGDRTLQWIEALRNGLFDSFKRLHVSGIHSRVVKRKVGWVDPVGSRKPEEIMEHVTSGIGDRAVVLGMGNMVGTGELLVDYWNRSGEIYGI